MARTPRKIILQDYSYFHVTWKCHNNEHLLKNRRIKLYLYRLLLAYKHKYGIRIYGYCFMDNHPHIVGQLKSVKHFSAFFQIVNGLLARFINREMGRQGQVVMDRFRSPQIETERHMIEVLHYVDLNPVKAGICSNPRYFEFSSYRHHAYGTPDPLLDPLPQGVSIDPESYRLLNRFILKRSRAPLPIYSTTYFIGSPNWVRRRKSELKSALEKKRQKISSA